MPELIAKFAIIIKSDHFLNVKPDKRNDYLLLNSEIDFKT